MKTDYTNVKVTALQAGHIAEELYGIKGKAMALAGERDFNFRISAEGKRYLLKVSRPDAGQDFLEFQQLLLQYVAASVADVRVPVPYPDLRGNQISETRDKNGQVRKVRLLSWIEGRLWSGVNPVSNRMLFSLGEQAARLTQALQGFEHPLAEREFEWDLAGAGWTRTSLHHFTTEQQEILRYFLDLYDAFQEPYGRLRKSVVHNDVNDNNVLVSEDRKDPEVLAIIDYGDAILPS